VFSRQHQQRLASATYVNAEPETSGFGRLLKKLGGEHKHAGLLVTTMAHLEEQLLILLPDDRRSLKDWIWLDHKNKRFRVLVTL
jgi:hypothetical protein